MLQSLLVYAITITDTIEGDATAVGTDDINRRIQDFEKELARIESSVNAMQAIWNSLPIDSKAYLILKADDTFSRITKKIAEAKVRYIEMYKQ